MNLARFAAHMLATRRRVQRHFPPALQSAIAAAVTQSEAQHGGELRFVIEASLEPHQLLRGTTPRERAIEVFSHLRVWDTQDNSGVLIYILFADRAIEIIADRGIDAKSGRAAWDRIAADMQSAFAQGAFERGALEGIAKVSEELATHAQPVSAPRNELPNDATFL
ncbi:MAG: TPM domain-containing protein [Pseudomonadota bacterium]